MFLLISRYTVPPEQMSDQLEGHREWVGQHVAAGHFVAAGPEVPLQGGVIAAVGVTRAQLEQWIQDDPYILHGLAECDIREYTIVAASTGAEALQA